LVGETCNVFAYGHTGSGKTHTIVGHHYDNDTQIGLVLAAARELFARLKSSGGSDTVAAEGPEDRLGLAVRLYEVRGKTAHDLLNGGMECYVREGADGQTHIRGPKEILENGKVRVCPVVAKSCWSFTQLHEVILHGLLLRKTGTSEGHNESSRTHAIFELEIIDQRLQDLREAVIECESELVPVGKKVTDIYLEEQMKSLIRNEDGQYTQNPNHPLDQARIDEAEAVKKRYEDRLKSAENAVAHHFESSKGSGLGGKYVFVDLAGSEYFDRNDGANARLKQSPQERQQSRQINADLFALKQVIRARASGQTRIPYRSSPLTMILRSHFEAGGQEQSAMILALSSEEGQYAATLNTLKYGNLFKSGN
jgi:hypothetical protein